MERREVLTALATGGSLAVAGCLDRMGFEERSIWRDPPMVADRPDAVYVPPAMEEMGEYGRGTAGPYSVALTYTVPHRFWLLADERSRVEVTNEDTHHLMCHVWDAETHTVLPAAVGVTLTGPEGTREFTPWPMLSQRMGVHYGDNVALPTEGSYTAEIRVGPLEVTGTGSFATGFDDVASIEIPFEYRHSDIHDLSFEVLDEDRWGDRDALPVMDHGHGHEMAHTPVSVGPPVDTLPGRLLGTEYAGDAAISALHSNDGTLVVTMRTPYNDFYLPFASLTVDIDDTTHALEERIDDEWGHYYGLEVGDLEEETTVRVSVSSPPAVSRHAGYETAFLEFEDVTFTA